MQKPSNILSNTIAEKIKKKIILGEYGENAKIPNEQDLASELNVSRTTIREAVKILVSKNILKIERGKGTYVASTPGLADDPLGLAFVPEPQLVLNICEFRVCVEPIVCRLAAQRGTPAQLEDLEKIVLKMEQHELALAKNHLKNSKRVDSLAELDSLFHMGLYAMSGNVIFERLTPAVNHNIIANYTTQLYRSGDQHLAPAESHRSLLNVICAHDADAAFALSLEHMLIMQKELSAFIPAP
jgi:GntR family transcriptional repressor for pyruvate dehydrogenase complex